MKNVYSHSTSNDYSINTIEYMVKKKTDSSIRTKRFLIIFLAVVISVAVCALTFRYVPAAGAIVIIFMAGLVKMLWGSTNIEYEYTISQGDMTMDAIIGAKKRKTVASFLIREAESIAKYDGKVPEGAIVINACISPDHPETWCAVYKDEKRRKTALLFSAFNKALDLMAYYNRTATSNERIKDSSEE